MYYLRKHRYIRNKIYIDVAQGFFFIVEVYSINPSTEYVFSLPLTTVWMVGKKSITGEASA